MSDTGTDNQSTAPKEIDYLLQPKDPKQDVQNNEKHHHQHKEHHEHHEHKESEQQHHHEHHLQHKEHHEHHHENAEHPENNQPIEESNSEISSDQVETPSTEYQPQTDYADQIVNEDQTVNQSQPTQNLKQTNSFERPFDQNSYQSADNTSTHTDTLPHKSAGQESTLIKKGILHRKHEKKDAQKKSTVRSWFTFSVELRENVLFFFRHDEDEDGQEEEDAEKDEEEEEKEKESSKDKDKKHKEDEEKRLKKEKEKKEKELKEAAKKKEKELKEAEKKKEKELKEKEKKEKEKEKEKDEKKKSKKIDLSISMPEEKIPEDEALLSPTERLPPPSHSEQQGQAIEVISIRGAIAEVATDYKKRKHVFRLITDIKAEYLFEASDEKEMKAWIDIINTYSKLGGPLPDAEIQKPQQAPTEDSKKPTKLLDKILGKTDKKIKHKKIFGADISDQPSSEDLGVPLFVEKCISVIEANGLDSVGIYRLSGNAGLINELREKVDQDISKVNFANPTTYDGDLNVVTGLLKSYFREMAEPLMTFQFYDSFIAAGRLEDYNDKMYSIQHVISLLPDVNYKTLKYLAEHLARIAEKEEENKMAPANLAIVFGPNLLRPKEESALTMMSDMNIKCAVIEAIVQQPAWMFSIEHHPQTQQQ